jgi:RNA polymerase sigma-70 factor (ECF subfamily)
MATNVVFQILYKDYYPRVFGLCRRILNSPTLAEDATQEAFMRAYKKFDSYDDTQPFWQWIATIANHHCIDLLRQRGRTKSLFGEEVAEVETLESADIALESQVITSENGVALNVAIAALPDKYRVPLVLAYFFEASYEQIAEDLSINQNHVGVLLLRAKQMLRSTMIDADRQGVNK